MIIKIQFQHCICEDDSWHPKVKYIKLSFSQHSFLIQRFENTFFVCFRIFEKTTFNFKDRFDQFDDLTLGTIGGDDEDWCTDGILAVAIS